MVHERTSWRVDGGFPEGKLAGVALQGLSRSPNRVADKRRLVVAGVITALLHLFWNRQCRAPTPSTPTSHLRSIHPKATGLSTVATNPHTPYKVTVAFEVVDTTNHNEL